jgi:hypothetical protein
MAPRCDTEPRQAETRSGPHGHLYAKWEVLGASSYTGCHYCSGWASGSERNRSKYGLGVRAIKIETKFKCGLAEDGGVGVRVAGENGHVWGHL